MLTYEINDESLQKSELEKMQSWFSSNDPVLLGKAVSWVNRNANNLKIDRIGYGNIISFTELTF